MNKEDYKRKCEELKQRKFYAEMSDDYSVTCAELQRINQEQIELDKKYKEGK